MYVFLDGNVDILKKWFEILLEESIRNEFMGNF